MANRKVVFVIVEGNSDETALTHFFKARYNPNEVYVYVEHGDITSKRGITSTNILKNIALRVQKYAKDYKLKNADFVKIIHVIDTDGVFIPDDCVVFDNCTPDPLYDTAAIKTANVPRIISRNTEKRQNVRKISVEKTVWNIDYRVFYMSCNLDHVLYDKPNSSNKEKEENAIEFYEKYENDYEGFLDFICNSDFSVKLPYKESWKFIADGLNSLGRHTNINLCFDDS